jgi:hypothetical protein
MSGCHPVERAIDYYRREPIPKAKEASSARKTPIPQHQRWSGRLALV